MNKINVQLILFFISFYVFSYCGIVLFEQNQYEVINVDALKPYLLVFMITSITNFYLVYKITRVLKNESERVLH